MIMRSLKSQRGEKLVLREALHRTPWHNHDGSATMQSVDDVSDCETQLEPTYGSPHVGYARARTTQRWVALQDMCWPICNVRMRTLDVRMGREGRKGKRKSGKARTS